MKQKVLGFILTVSLVLLCFGCARTPIVKTVLNNNYTLSSRWFRTSNPKDGQGTISLINQLHPGRIDWMYCEDKEQLKLIRKAGLKYSLTINNQVPDSLGYTTAKLRIKDYNGRLYIAPWMKNWKIKNPYWGCVNNPGFFDLYFKQGLKLASLGAYAIMVDGPEFNVQLHKENIVGCFCYYCEQKFREQEHMSEQQLEQFKLAIKNNYEIRTPYNAEQKLLVDKYAKIQKSSVIAFFKKWRTKIRHRYPSMLFYCNNYNGSWDSIYLGFDGGIAELKTQNINKKTLDSLYAVADRLQKSQIFSAESDNPNVHLQLMEYNARHHRTSMLPWDVYVPNKPRYFMKVKELDSIITVLHNKYNY